MKKIFRQKNGKRAKCYTHGRKRPFLLSLSVLMYDTFLVNLVVVLSVQIFICICLIVLVVFLSFIRGLHQHV